MEQSVLSKIEDVSRKIDPLFPNMNLPLEMAYLILSKLPIEHLERLWVFNKDWFILTKILCFDFYRSAFQESTLWSYLPQDPLMQNIPLPDYFGQFLNKSWQTKLPLADCVNLEKFIASQYINPGSLNELLVGIDCKMLVKEEKYLIQQRQAREEESFIDFMENPESPLTWLEIARAYRHIETALNLLLLAYFISIDKTSFNESIWLILDRRLTRWITGPGIELFVERESKGELLLSHVINFALGEGDLFLSCSDKKQRDIYQGNAKELLYCLTDHDCWSLAITQGPIIVYAIERRCFPIIDRFGQKTLVGVIGDNPNEKMLLVLLERFDAARLSSVLVSLGIEKSFQKIVSDYSQFMGLLLSQLSREQLCGMVDELSHTRFFYLISGSPFLEFLKILNVESAPKEVSYEKAIVSTSSKISPIRFFPRITCDPRTLLLGFVQLKSYYIDEIIKSRCVKYLLPSDILRFLKRYPDLWDILPVKVLDKFTAQELLALAAINIKAVPCIVERKYLESKFTDVKDLIEFAMRYMEDSTVPKVTRTEIVSIIQSFYNAWHQKVTTSEISNDSIESLRYWRLFLQVEKLKDTDLEWLEAECKKDTPVIYTAMLQKTESLQYQRRHPKQPDAPIPAIKIVPTDALKIPNIYPILPFKHQNSSAPVLQKNEEEPFLLDKSSQGSVLPISAIETRVLLPAQSKAKDLTSPSKEQHTAVAKTQPSRKTQHTSQQPMPAQQLNDVPSQNNISTNIILSIAKGFVVGLLVMGLATLLLMFINYQMNIPLDEIINELWITAIIGAVSEVVATICFLVNAKVCGASSANCTNEADNPTHQYVMPFQNAQAGYSAIPTNRNQPLFADSTASASVSHMQQISKATSLGNNFSADS